MRTVSAPPSIDALRVQGWIDHQLPGHMGELGRIWTLPGQDGEPWRFGLFAAAQHLNPIGLVHGGVLLSLMDHAVSTVVWETNQRTPCVTVQLDSQFVSSVREGDFGVVSVFPMHCTKSMAFMRAEMHVQDQLVMSAQAIIKVLMPR